MKRDQDTHWLDQFSLAKNRDVPAGPLEVFFTNPFSSGIKPQAAGCVQLLPGVDALDLYANSVRAEIWKDGVIVPCFVPQSLIGWEFLSPLWPQPSGTAPLRLSAAVELLIGRSAGCSVCPSLLFAFVPASHLHAPIQTPNQVAGTPAQASSKSATIQSCERLCGNLDANCRTLVARLLVLCPATVYKDTVELPDEQNWGLFIGPRSRTLVLLNRCRGRIDLNLASLLAMDSVFRSGQNLIDATARLFEPFGSKAQVPALFGASFDPLKVHSGFTNATVAEHLSETLDGREDYWQLFGVKLPVFFLSNASNNIGFLTPYEAQQLHAGTGSGPPLASNPLPDMPRWSLQGHLTEVDQNQVLAYRMRMRPLMPPPDTGGGFLQLLGLDNTRGSGDWFPTLGGACSEMSFGNDAQAIGQTAGFGNAQSASTAVGQSVSQGGGSPSFGQGYGQEQTGSFSPPLPPPSMPALGNVGGDPEPEPQAWIQAKNAQAKTLDLGPGGRSDARGRQPSRGNGASGGSASGGSRSASADHSRAAAATGPGRHEPSSGVAMEH